MLSGLLRRSTVVIASTVVIVAAIPAAQAQTDQADRAAIDAAIAAVKPALVRIFVAEVEYDEGREVKMEASGSGVIINNQGYVVTNHHVAGRAKRLVCTMAGKEQIDADLIGTDALTDVAVIKLRPTTPREFPVASWGDSSKLRVGDRVFAMGCPLALSQSVTMGIVSNTEMIMPDYMEGMFTLEGEDVGSMVKWIGHDAAISPGNSGGPLVNEKGQIVGLNEIDMGLGGAIPSNLVREVAEQIIKNGTVKRSWIGLGIQPLLKSGKGERGALVGGVMPGSPAKAAGFKTGDVLVRLAGKDVTVRFAEELPPFNQMVAALPIGEEVEAVVLRDGQEVTLRIKTESRPEAEPKECEIKQWGVCSSNISFVKARTAKRSSQNGVLVCSVRPGGPCSDAKPSVEPDDIIVEVQGKPVNNCSDLIAITESITKGKTEPTPVLVSFDRGTERLITVVKVGVQNFEDPGREVKKAYLPVATQVLTTDIAEALGLTGRTGVRVTQVFPGTSAEKAGLKVGDLIVQLDGDEIAASQPEDSEVFSTMIRQYKSGKTVKLTVIRDGKETTVPVVLEESRPLTREMKKYLDDSFEFSARDMAFYDRVQKNIDKSVVGIYIEDVSEGGWAALGGLKVGDVIRSIDGLSVPDVATLRTVMNKIQTERPKYVVLRVERGIQEKYIELETDWSGTKLAAKGETK